MYRIKKQASADVSKRFNGHFSRDPLVDSRVMTRDTQISRPSGTEGWAPKTRVCSPCVHTLVHRHWYKSYDYTVRPVFDKRAVPTRPAFPFAFHFIFHSHSTRHTSTPTPIRRRDARGRVQTTHVYRPATTNDGIRGRAFTHSFHFV